MHAPTSTGAAELVRHFHKIGMPLAICTGSSQHTYEAKVSKRKELFSCFSHVVCADDKEVKNGKPAPDIYLVTSKRFSNHPESCSNVGITHIGVLNVQSLNL